MELIFVKKIWTINVFEGFSPLLFCCQNLDACPRILVLGARVQLLIVINQTQCIVQLYQLITIVASVRKLKNGRLHNYSIVAHVDFCPTEKLLGFGKNFLKYIHFNLNSAMPLNLWSFTMKFYFWIKYQITCNPPLLWKHNS